jgi:hypothetical protein
LFRHSRKTAVLGNPIHLIQPNSQYNITFLSYLYWNNQQMAKKRKL